MTLAGLEAALRALGVRSIRCAVCHDGAWRVSGLMSRGGQYATPEAHAPSLHDAMAEFLDACRAAAGKAA